MPAAPEPIEIFLFFRKGRFMIGKCGQAPGGAPSKEGSLSMRAANGDFERANAGKPAF